MLDIEAINRRPAESSQCELTAIGHEHTPPGQQEDGDQRPTGGDSLLANAAAAGQALCEYFLANADRGDNVANDQLVAELTRRIRAQRSAGQR